MTPENCLGLYCGRIYSNKTGWSECGACPSGYRVDIHHLVCQKCDESPSIYEWLYLGFMFMLPIFKQWMWILEKYSSGKKEAMIQLTSCFFENVIAIITSLLIYQPMGSFNLVSCGVTDLSDWYTVLYNPKINHTKVVHCAQEAVYPLYSLVFVVYLLSLVLMLMLRVWISNFFINKSWQRKHRTDVLYRALYLYPILAGIHGTCAGLTYYAYPYIIVMASILGLVSYCVRRQALTVTKLFVGEDWRQHIIFLIWHFCTLSYSILAIGSSFDFTGRGVSSDLPYLSVVPIPLIFLLFTESFTRPERIEEEPIGDTL